MRIIFFSLIVLWWSSIMAQVDLKAIDQYIRKAQIDWEVPGLSVAIVKDGATVLAKGYGVKSMGQNEPVDEHTLFAIASNSKAFTSASLAMLVEAGKLHWDDPVQRYLPFFSLYDPYVSSHATVRDLLCHRLGLGTFSGDVLWYKSHYTAEEVVKRVKHLPQAYEFRSGYGYSNLMFMAAGEVIKAASGLSWDQYVRTHIFTPLGMSRSLTTVSELQKTGNFASPHKSIYGPAEPIPYVNWDNMGAAGGILSSASDMARWIQLQLAGGSWQGKTLFKPESQEVFWTIHNSFPVSAATRRNTPGRNYSGYALGWSVTETAGQRIIAHSGGYDGMYSQVMLVPDLHLGIVVLTNSMTSVGSMLCNYIVAKYLDLPEKKWSEQALENNRKGQQERRRWVEERQQKRLSGTMPIIPLNDLAGTFHDPLYGDIIITADGSKLKMHFPHAPALDAILEHWHHQTYQILWNEPQAWFDFGTVQFVLDNNAAMVTGIEFDVPNEDIFFDEIHAKRVEKQ